MTIDKSTRQHYAIQGGGPNYLGKQKMVTAPKKWLSSPDHEPAELAYITEKEKDILLDLNLYGSLKNGKPNRGPSGIISLQGDMGGYGGTGGGGQGGESNREKGIREAAQRAAKSTKTGPSETRDRPTSFLGPEDKKQKKAAVEDARETYISETGKRQKGITQEGGDAELATKIALEDEEFTDDELEKGITDDGRTIEYIGDTPVTNKRAKEFNLGLKERNIKTGEIQQGRNIINPFTQQIQSRLAPIDKPKKGLLGTLGTMALGIVAPALLPAKLAKAYSTYNQLRNISKLASNFTGKDIVSDLTSKSNIRNLLSRKTTPTDTRDDRFRGDRGEGKQAITAPKADVVTESIQKFSPRQMDLVRQRYDQLQQVIQTGMYNGQRLNNNQLVNLQNTSKQMQAFLVDPQKTMMMARGGLAGLHG